MSAFGERREQDLAKLRELSERSGNRVRVVRTVGSPISLVELELHYKTAPNNRYPNEVQGITNVKIELPAKYPFAEPSATITSPIFHPNVYSTGRVCFGVKWLASEGLDLLVQRLIQIITFDTLILNEKSPANTTALAWYKNAKNKGGQFPTDSMSRQASPNKPQVKWTTVSNAEAERVMVSCPSCSARLGLPGGKVGKVVCPKCRSEFEART
jgi:ubiquitin-protein ligase